MLRSPKNIVRPATEALRYPPQDWRSMPVALQEQLLEGLFNHPRINLAVLDADGLPILGNGRIRALLGDGVTLFVERAREAMRYLTLPTSFENVFPTPAGTTVRLQISLSRLAGGTDEPARILAIVEDVSEAHAAASAVATAEAKFRSIFEHALEGIFQTSPDGRYMSANPALARIYGYASPEEMMEQLVDIGRQLYVAEDRRREFQAIMESQDEVRDFVSEVYRRDGTAIWISETVRAVRADDGTLLYYEGMVEDITERRRAEAKLVHDALHDGLTGLPNRALFMNRLDHAFHRLKREPDRQFAVLFIDGDRFKMINDSLGHAAGDALIVALGERFRACVRAMDLLARLAGDEFAVLVEQGILPGDVPQIAQRIHKALEEPFHIAGAILHISASIGIAISDEAHRSPGEVLRDADIAMYEAKNRGRGQTVQFEQGMHVRAVHQLQVENDLRLAMERGELHIHYQPVVRLSTGRPLGVEALVRWYHPTAGVIYPDGFIGVAEETGLIDAMGEFVLRQACRQMLDWHARGVVPEDFKLSVNLAPAQLRAPDIVARIARVLMDTGFPVAGLQLEITESAMLDNPVAAHAKLSALKESGIGLAIDDFGTGYSALSHLHRFPISTLKIDRSFVSGADSGLPRIEIVRTILALGQSLGLEVVAEGVETEEQALRLAELGCGCAQGYHFSRAQPPEALEGWLSAWRSAA